MRFPTFSKFICCINLECGIKLIGWLSVAYNTFALALLAFLWITHGDKSIIELVEKHCVHIAGVLKHFNEVSVYQFLIYIAYSMLRIYAAAKLLNSLTTRNPRDTILYMVLKVLSIIFLTISIFFHTNGYFVIFLIFIFLTNGYIFGCVYSMHDKLVQESFGRIRLVGEDSPYYSVL